MFATNDYGNVTDPIAAHERGFSPHLDGAQPRRGGRSGYRPRLMPYRDDIGAVSQSMHSRWLKAGGGV